MEVAQLLYEIQESQASTIFASIVNRATLTMVAAVSYFNKKMNSRIISLTADFFAIKPIFFKQILKNKFDPINIFKLCMDISLLQPKIKSIELKKSIKINTGADDAGSNDIKRLAYLLYCLGVY